MATAGKSLSMGVPNLECFARTLEELAATDQDIVVVTSDSRGSGKLVPFGQKYPDQVVEIGIAEQNLVGVASGLASAGKKVFAVSPSCFLTARSLEQIKNDVAYSNHPVNLVGISAGVSYGALGSTHHSLHDVAVLRAIHNINIIVPADNFETRAAIEVAAHTNQPFFLKFGKLPLPDLPRIQAQFTFGKGSVIREGSDVVIIACGETVYRAYEAALILESHHLSARVVSMHTIKPLDEDMILKSADDCGAVLTVEEHSVHGGLGEACASVLMQHQRHVPFHIIGIPDEDTVTGSQTEILNHYEINAEGISKRAMELIKNKRK